MLKLKRPTPVRKRFKVTHSFLGVFAPRDRLGSGHNYYSLLANTIACTVTQLLLALRGGGRCSLLFFLNQPDFAKKCITHKLTKDWVPSKTGNIVTIGFLEVP